MSRIVFSRWHKFLALGAVALVGGCMTLGVLTKREAVAIVDHAMSQAGCKRSDVGIDSTFSVSVDRFMYHAVQYDIVVETTHEQGRVDRTYRRGRKKNDRDIDIPWSAITRVITKSNPVSFGDTYTQSVQFFFMRRAATTDLIEDSFEIGNLQPNPKYGRDAVGELALAIKVLAGMEPPARDDYHNRHVYDYDQDPAWRRSVEPEPGGEVRAQPTGTPAPPARVETEIAPPPARPALSDDVERELLRLKDLFDRGLINADAYKERQLQLLTPKP